MRNEQLPPGPAGSAGGSSQPLQLVEAGQTGGPAWQRVATSSSTRLCHPWCLHAAGQGEASRLEGLCWGLQSPFLAKLFGKDLLNRKQGLLTATAPPSPLHQVLGHIL